MEGLLILKKDSNIFKVESNLEDIRWRNLIINSADSILERKDEWEHENESKSLILKGKKDKNSSWDEGFNVLKIFLEKK